MAGKKPLVWKTVKVQLGKLKPWVRNPRESTQTDADGIGQSLDEFGYSEVLLIGPGFELYDGHQRLPVMLRKYGPKHVVECRQSNRALTETERRKLTAFLHAKATGRWNWDALSAWDGKELADWGFDKGTLKNWKTDVNALDKFLKSEQDADGLDAEPQIDRAAELAEKWQTKSGQLWKLGEHRLLIGDCTVRENVERLMGGERADMTFIDPPYNALKSWNKDEAHSETRLDPSAWFENDNMEWSEYWEFMARVFENLQGHSAYICCDFRIYGGLKPLVEAAGYKVKHCIVWKKNVFGLGKRYRFQHEFIIYACKDKAPFYGDRSQSDVWEMDIKKTTEHNTPKPVELPQKAISNSLESGAIMFDGFCGHGTTIIAAHNLNRRCYAMEISEKYGAVILERFFEATGITPKLEGKTRRKSPK